MSQNLRSHNGGLFCSEGSQHVGRPSVKVHHPPGGSNSTWNFLQGEQPTTYNSNTSSNNNNQQYVQQQQAAPAQHVPIHRRGKDVEVTGKIGQDSGSSRRDAGPSNGGSYNPITDQTTYYNDQRQQSNASASQQQQQQPAPALGALFCVEGSQVRNKPAVRIVGEQRRNYNIISG